MQPLLLQALFVPIVASPVAYLLGRRFAGRSGWFSFAILLYSTLLLVFAATSVPDYVETYPWQPFGQFGLRADGLSLPFAATIYLLSSALAVYSVPYMTRRIEEQMAEDRVTPTPPALGSRLGLYFALYLIYASGMFGTVLATNLIQFYIFFEIMLVPSAFLIAEFGYGERTRIAVMYFLWTHIGALALLAGLLWTGFTFRSFDFDVIEGLALTQAVPEIVRVGLAALITLGLFVKLAAFGLHIWLPYAHAEAPTPISALLSPAMIGIGGYALVRLLIMLVPSAYAVATPGMALWGLVTMFYGGMMALMQDDIKRLLAYSSVSQMGYIIFGVSTAYFLGVSGSVFQYVSHGTGKAILFMVAGAIMLQTHGLRSISRMGGLSRRLPATATAAMIGFLVIIGLPYLNGFQAEWMLFAGAFAGALQEQSMFRLVLAGLALAATPVTAGYTLWAMRRIFFGPLPSHLQRVEEAPLTILAPIFVLVVVSIILGVYPALIVDRLVPVMQAALAAGLAGG